MDAVYIYAAKGSSLKAAQKTANEKKKKIVCRFFAKSGWCKFEEKCRFVHGEVSGSVETTKILDTQQNTEQDTLSQTTQQQQTNAEEASKTEPTSQHVGTKTNQKVCRYYKTRGGCVRGSACKFYHVTIASQHKDTSEPNTPKRGVHAQAKKVISTIEKLSLLGDEQLNTSEPNTPKRGVHAQAKKVISTIEKLSLLGDEQLYSLRTRELEQLVRRFGKHKATQLVHDGPGTTYTINFTPSDPDWPFDIESLLVTVTFPDEYPKQMFDAGLARDQTLPLELIRCVNQQIIKWIENQQQIRNKKDTVDLPFRPFLRWLDRSLEKLFILAAKHMKKSEEHCVEKDDMCKSKECSESSVNINNEEESTSKDTHIKNESCNETSDTENVDPCRQKPNQQKRKPNTDATPDRKELLLSDFLVVKNKAPKIKAVSNSKAHHHGDNSLNPKNDHIVFVNQESGEPVTVRHHAEANDITCDDTMETLSWGDVMANDDQLSSEKNGESPNAKPRGTEIRFRGLELFENTSTLRTDSVALTVECDKCKTKFDSKADSTRTTAMRCERCTNVIKLGFTPCIVHQYSACTLGYLDLQGCHPFDVVMADMCVVAGCLACSSETSIKGPQYGSNQAWCNKCHQKLKFQIESTRFFELMPTSVLSDKNAGHIPLPKKKPKAPGLKEGLPLRDNGTCKHYKKSYRWLRFPCCGKCYPCDVCHDEEESHEMKYATRMVCGFCSKEQPFSHGACIACGLSTTRAKTSHWEGGKGCRNRTAMSRGDEKKFKNTRKTTSRKSQAKTSCGNTK